MSSPPLALKVTILHFRFVCNLSNSLLTFILQHSPRLVKVLLKFSTKPWLARPGICEGRAFRPHFFPCKMEHGPRKNSQSHAALPKLNFRCNSRMFFCRSTCNCDYLVKSPIHCRVRVIRQRIKVLVEAVGHPKALYFGRIRHQPQSSLPLRRERSASVASSSARM